MMNYRQILIIGYLLMMTILPAMSQSIESPITRAMMRVYDEVIDENPRDYETLLRRGNEYYNHDMYKQALDDVNNALRYIPTSDKDTRLRALMLRANVYAMSNRYSDAVADLDEALTLSPDNLVAVYLRANALYNLGEYQRSQADYATLLRRNPRNQKAMFGLAKIAVKQNNLGVAGDYADRAVELSPAVSDVYMRRAEVRRLAANYQGAADDYIMAISTDSENTPRALQELFSLSNGNYSTVMSCLTEAIRRAPRQGMFYYIRAMIAQGHFKYSAAIDDYDKLINEKMYAYEGLNASLAECYYALGKYETALFNVDYAISANPDRAEYYVLKSNILRATGDARGAVEQAENALSKSPDNKAALEAKALALVAGEEYQQASVLLSEAIMTDSADPYLQMLRGWILTDYRSQPDIARRCYEEVIEMNFDIDQVRSYKGFALAFIGKDNEAEQWMNTILNTADNSDGMISYYAACFYAQKGMKDVALRHVEAALDKGYANYHNWMVANEARINVAPLRDDPRFKALLDKYVIIFK
ncbi:MAG: tetratricopeptide repeat protein [Muribaculaceae bacterium]|nr:tetratricopeptide repeat protein [Muribaculaceae bacterium]